MKIGLIGTRGVPARYGGFETCVEEVGARLVERGHLVRVFCRTGNADDMGSHHRGMELIHLPALPKRSLETLSHTALSVINKGLAGADAALVFNAANAPLLPVIRLRGIPVATHVDGLEWRRGKWGPTGQKYYRAAEALSVRWSDALIADAQGIADYYRDEFNAPTELIAYGAPLFTSTDPGRVRELGLEPQRYHLVVARFEPENHVLEIVQGYVASDAKLPLVVVGSAPYADEYTNAIAEAADDRVRLLGGVWDQDQLNELYAGALSYLHGHSVGGTNPSLLRAAGAGTYTLAYDVAFNREVLGDDAGYWQHPADVSKLIMETESTPPQVAQHGIALREAIRRYDWDDVADSYEALCSGLAGRSFPARRPSGRRTGRASVRHQTKVHDHASAGI